MMTKCFDDKKKDCKNLVKLTNSKNYFQACDKKLNTTLGKANRVYNFKLNVSESVDKSPDDIKAETALIPFDNQFDLTMWS